MRGNVSFTITCPSKVSGTLTLTKLVPSHSTSTSLGNSAKTDKKKENRVKSRELPYLKLAS